MRSIQRIIALIAIFAAGIAAACQYNVRDVGFVDLGGTSYTLYGIVDDSVPAEFRAYMEQSGRETFLESNVRFQFPDEDAPIDAAEKLPKPAAVLTTPDGRTRAIALSPTNESFDLRIQSIINSPLRESLIADLIEHYAVLLVVHGPEEFDNELAVDAADGARLHTTARMMMLPKEVKSPPIVRELTVEEAKAEDLFLWSLGMSDLSDTQVVVLYGRGRVMGAPLRGLDIEQKTLEIFLDIIGSDCECGLDRRWMQGPTFPAKWDSERTAVVAEAIGFDPENPMIKAEMSSVLGKNAGANKGPDDGLENLDDVLAGLAMGYVEASVDFEAEVGEASNEALEGSTTSEIKVEDNSNELEPAAPVAQSANKLLTMTMGGLVLIAFLGSLAVVILRRSQA